MRDVTMRDVASRAGVAVSTVSRVMSHPQRVSARTRETVWEAMRDLGYRANGGSRASGRSVCVLIPDITNPFYFDLIRGSQDRLKASGFTQILIEDSVEVETGFMDLLDHSVVGAILVSPRLDDADIKNAAERIPIVTVNRAVSGVSGVMIDSGVAVEQAVEHLASLGHRRICYVGGPGHSRVSKERWQACRRATERLAIDAVQIGPFIPRTEAGAAAADAVLNTKSTAAIAFNDLIAIGMLQRFAARGIPVPDQVSVVGCDDIFGSDFCHPPLTTLTGAMTEAGREATELLLNYANGRAAAQPHLLSLPSHLTIRRSTGPAPAST